MSADDLEKAPADIWQHLVVGNGAWRIPVLASCNSGSGADARTVVLRSVTPADRELVFFTDRRSRKLAQLQADPAVCLVVYDNERRLQARLYGRALREHDTKMLDTWWQGLAEHQRVHYAVDVLAEGEKGRENFAAFRVEIQRIHCLWIQDQGDTRAEFEWRNGQWQGATVRV